VILKHHKRFEWPGTSQAVLQPSRLWWKKATACVEPYCTSVSSRREAAVGIGAPMSSSESEAAGFISDAKSLPVSAEYVVHNADGDWGIGCGKLERRALSRSF
jgi:hypothetical protein